MLAQLDRGALPKFGLLAEGVHVNGLVRRPTGFSVGGAAGGRQGAGSRQARPHRRRRRAGGADARQTLIKEAAEEAAIPAESQARR